MEKEVISETDFGDFVFTKHATLDVKENSNFFKRIAVEKKVNKLLNQH
ncbi:MAG: hypothetical protein RM022_002675 [Nostoc sp. EfeVER01]|nr:hypothetical protein [Nostoc sp. EfeVER01]MDZ7945560.1 hypothetical protein [Nostoc sp. EfeVER01]